MFAMSEGRCAVLKRARLLYYFAMSPNHRRASLRNGALDKIIWGKVEVKVEVEDRIREDKRSPSQIRNAYHSLS
jgi:hypothetical protein